MVAEAEEGNLIPTTLNSSEFARVLHDYDPVLRNYVVQGIHSGFHIGYEGPIVSTFCFNSPTVAENADIARELIQKEVSLGRIAGPYFSPPFAPFKVSPLTLRPKSTPGQYRLIHNLSAPYDGTSVNDNIADACKSVQYQSLTGIIGTLLDLGKGSYLAKADVQSAFRLVPVHPSCYPLLGFHFENAFYFDRCLTMGGGSSCRIFEAISSAINWALENMYGVKNAFHYLDDFCFLENSYDKCLYDLQVFSALCEKLGVPLAPEKKVGPSTNLSFLGVGLDTQKMEAFLTPEKIDKYRTNILHLLSVQWATQAEVKTVIGQLNWCTAIVVSGRSFIRRLHDLALGPHLPHKLVFISNEVKKDLQVWLDFLSDFNGRVFLDFMPVETSASINFYTDASFKGAGGVCGKHWFQFAYPPSWSERGITYLELYPIVVGAHIFVEHLAGKKIIFFTDNYAVMVILNKCTSPNKKFMPLIRKLVLLSMKYRFRIVSKHVKGALNIVPDKISRFQVSREFVKYHNLNSMPTSIPTNWMPTSWHTLEKCY